MDNAGLPIPSPSTHALPISSTSPCLLIGPPRVSLRVQCVCLCVYCTCCSSLGFVPAVDLTFANASAPSPMCLGANASLICVSDGRSSRAINFQYYSSCPRDALSLQALRRSISIIANR